MKDIVIYGIKNCDSMKKTFAWFDGRKIPYVFHDYKKSGADAAVVKRAVSELGWEGVLNRKGTTWRGLPDKVKEGMTDKRAVAVALDNPSVIRRPLIVWKGGMHAGYDEDAFKSLFRAKK